MNARDRYRETLLFGNPDKVPLAPGGFGPVKSTLSAWHQQGLPEGLDWQEYLFDSLGIDPEAGQRPVNLGINTEMMPHFEVKILEHMNGHYIVQDFGGFIIEISDQHDLTDLRDENLKARDYVTRRYLSFPVKDRADWEELKTRFDPETEGRLPPNFKAQCDELRQRKVPIAIKFHGPFWQLRDWLGFETLCLTLIDDPDFIQDLVAFWTEFVSAMMTRVFEYVKVDVVLFGEDMAYKQHSMISPTMARRFLQPAYECWIPQIVASGCPLVDVDSDGYLGELIPLWIEWGVNCCHPMEVAAGNDIVAYRQRFGKDIAFRWGIDKRALAAGGGVMRDEVLRVVLPLLKDGGYIPGIDHGVPSDVSWPNFVEYTRLLAQLTGWI